MWNSGPSRKADRCSRRRGERPAGRGGRTRGLPASRGRCLLPERVPPPEGRQTANERTGRCAAQVQLRLGSVEGTTRVPSEGRTGGARVVLRVGGRRGRRWPRWWVRDAGGCTDREPVSERTWGIERNRFLAKSTSQIFSKTDVVFFFPV